MESKKASSLDGDISRIEDERKEQKSVSDKKVKSRNGPDGDPDVVTSVPGDVSNQVTLVNGSEISVRERLVEDSVREARISDSKGVANGGFEVHYDTHPKAVNNEGNKKVINEAYDGQTDSTNDEEHEYPKRKHYLGHVNYIIDQEEKEIWPGEKKLKDEKEENVEVKTEKEDGLNSGSTSYMPVEEKGQGRYSTWRSWLKEEFKWNRKLIPIKIIQFLYSGGTNSVLPYLTLHMKELGLSMKQIGWIYAFLPISTILGPPISGLVADRTGNYKAVVLMNMILSTVLHLALLYLPGEGVNKLTFSCTESYASAPLVWDKCRDCHDRYEGMDVNVTLMNCKYVCDNTPASIFELCFNAGGNTTEFCQQHNVTAGEIINRPITASYTDEGLCGHSWYGLKGKSQSYFEVSCPSASCPIECEVEGVPSCLMAGEESSSTVFWTYFFVRMIANFFLSSLFTMMDAMTIAIVKEQGGDYGKQRLLFIIGMATVPLFAGFLNDWDNGTNGTSYYLPALYLGTLLCLASAVLIARLNFKVDMAEANMFQNLRKLVTRADINVYFLVVLVLGSNWGFIESYLFLYMGQLGSPNYLMGLTMTVGSILGMPTMLVADPVINVIGRHNIFIISFFAYALRHFGYSFISSPWMVFPFEALEVFTYQLMWVAAITYCPILAPPGLLATMMGVAGAIHYSIGRGVGSFIGGQLIARFNIPGAFRCFGVIAIVSGVVYIFLHFCYFKKKIAEMELKRSQKASSDTEMELKRSGKASSDSDMVEHY